MSTFLLDILYFYDKQMRPHASRNCDKGSLFFSFKALNLLRTIQCLRKCRVNTHKHVAYEKNCNFNLRVSARTHANCHIFKFVLPTWKKQRINSSIYIYRSCFMLHIDLSGSNGSVSNGLGANISPPHCPATGIWYLASKRTSGTKSRGASFGRTLWR